AEVATQYGSGRTLTFTDQLMQSSASRAIVEGVLHIAHELDIKVIAEGVETELQAERLRNIGCACGQGHLFSPAVDFERATRMLHSPNVVALPQKRMGIASDPPILH
ncbi:EAL domain-containing protein, partial [Sphingomonas sp. ATCC 31555]